MNYGQLTYVTCVRLRISVDMLQGCETREAVIRNNMLCVC